MHHPVVCVPGQASQARIGIAETIEKIEKRLGSSINPTVYSVAEFKSKIAAGNRKASNFFEHIGVPEVKNLYRWDHVASFRLLLLGLGSAIPEDYVEAER